MSFSFGLRQSSLTKSKLCQHGNSTEQSHLIYIHLIWMGKINFTSVKVKELVCHEDTVHFTWNNPAEM